MTLHTIKIYQQAFHLQQFLDVITPFKPKVVDFTERHEKERQSVNIQIRKNLYQIGDKQCRKGFCAVYHVKYRGAYIRE